MTVRQSLIDEIHKVVGDSARIIGYEDSHDEPDVPVITLKQRTIARLPEAPAGSLRIDYVITVTAAQTDPEKAETALDTFVPALLADLSPLKWLGWDEAEKKLDGQNLAYDIGAYVIARPVTPTKAAPAADTKKEA